MGDYGLPTGKELLGGVVIFMLIGAMLGAIAMSGFQYLDQHLSVSVRWVQP